MSISIEDYIFKDTAIKLLCEIDPRGSRLEELDERMPVSRSTISEVLNQGNDLGLIQPIAVREENVRRKHRLTPKGATLRLVLDDMGTTAAYEQYKDALTRYESHVGQSRLRIIENLDSLDDRFEDAHNDALDRLLDRPDYSEIENENE